MCCIKIYKISFNRRMLEKVCDSFMIVSKNLDYFQQRSSQIFVFARLFLVFFLCDLYVRKSDNIHKCYYIVLLHCYCHYKTFKKSFLLYPHSKRYLISALSNILLITSMVNMSNKYSNRSWNPTLYIECTLNT